MNQLRDEVKSQKHGNSPQEKDSYYKWRAEWQHKVTAKEHEIDTKKAKIKKLQKQMSDLQQQLASLQKAGGKSSEKALPPNKVIPRK